MRAVLVYRGYLASGAGERPNFRCPLVVFVRHNSAPIWAEDLAFGVTNGKGLERGLIGLLLIGPRPQGTLVSGDDAILVAMSIELHGLERVYFDASARAGTRGDVVANRPPHLRMQVHDLPIGWGVHRVGYQGCPDTVVFLVWVLSPHGAVLILRVI